MLFNRKWTLPNILTISRMILVIPFIICLTLGFYYKEGNISYSNVNTSLILFIISGLIFIVAMFTDFLDGYLARKNNQISNFGKLFDPLADKWITTSALIIFTIYEIVPFWITLLFVLRDILIDGVRNLAASNNKIIAASWWGKWKTITLSIALICIFIFFPLIDKVESNLFYFQHWKMHIITIPLLIAALLNIFSAINYFGKIREIL